MPQMMVTAWLCSPPIILPTVLEPHVAIILAGSYTLEITFSSMFQTDSSTKVPSLSMYFDTLKNCVTLIILEATACDKLVAVGTRMLGLRCRILAINLSHLHTHAKTKIDILLFSNSLCQMPHFNCI